MQFVFLDKWTFVLNKIPNNVLKHGRFEKIENKIGHKSKYIFFIDMKEGN